MTIRIVLVISMLATVAPAAVKRDDFGTSASGSGGSSQPVYSPSSSASYSAPASSSFAGNNYGQAAPQYGAQSGDHQAAASTTNFQGQGANSQGNLYYYYYPVQDKNKQQEQGAGYQAAASNQYASSVTPNFGSQPAASSDSVGITSQLGGGDNTASSLSNAASDLNYSAQDLSYSAQTLPQGLTDYSSATGTQQNSNVYDQTLSNLASQLQQYGYAASSPNSNNGNGNGNNGASAGAFGQSNSAPQTYNGNNQQQNAAYGQSYTYEPSQGSQASGSEQTNAYQAAAQQQAGQQQQQINPNQQAAYQAAANAFGAAAAQQAANGQLQGYHQGAGGFANYPGAGHFGNFAAGSGQHSAFEPSAASGYRRYGIGSFLMPMLALAGLSLLIPTVTSLTAASGRKKRSTDPTQSAKEASFGKYFDRMERYYSIYKTAVEKEECMNRIICELGDAMTAVRGKSAIFT